MFFSYIEMMNVLREILFLSRELSIYSCPMKLQKYLAHAWICSRRKAETYIQQWLVSVNGERAHIGQIIDPEKDAIILNDTIIEHEQGNVYYIFHKPRNVITTCLSRETPDQIGILDIVDIPERVFPIWRLDKETTGLIMLTSDGRLSNYLMHPRYAHEKEYVVEVYGKIDESALEKMRNGVTITLKDNGSRRAVIRKIPTKLLEKTPLQRSWTRWETEIPTKQYTTRPCTIVRLSSSKFSIVLREGKNRQIRRMVESVWYDIKRLKRIRIENIELGNLLEGEWRPVTKKEKDELFRRIGII